MNRKGSITLIAIILAVIVLAMYLGSLATRGCSSNKDCGQTAYCGSDYECHNFPKEIIVQENNFLPAALVLGLALVVAAVIFRANSRNYFQQ